MNVIRNASLYLDELSDSEKKVLRFIEKDPNVVIQYTIQQIAMMAGTSVSAVQRFTKSIGYSGYREFRSALVRLKDSGENEDLSDDQDPVRSLADSFSYIMDRLKYIDRDLIDELCNDICSAEKIILLGRYRNKTVVDKMVMNLMDLGITCVCAYDEISYEHILYITDPKSCVIIFSSVGELRDTIHFFQQLKQASDKRWLITNNLNPKIGKYASRQITLPGTQAAGSYPVSAQFVMMAFVEILTVLIAKKKRSEE